MKYCSQCGASIEEKAAFCASCGGSLQAAAKQGRGFRKGVAATLAAAVLAVGVLWMTTGRTPADEASNNDSDLGKTSAVVTEEVGLVGELLGREPRVFLTILAGEKLAVELETPISSVDSKSGDRFRARTTQAISVEGRAALPAGTQVIGHVAHAKRSDKVKGRAELTLEFDRVVTVAGKEISIEAEALHLEAKSTKKKDAAKIGIGAGAGALVGAIVGGKKGAAIGTAVGGGAGTGAVLATRGEELVLPEGTPITTRLLASVTVEAPKPSTTE